MVLPLNFWEMEYLIVKMAPIPQAVFLELVSRAKLSNSAQTFMEVVYRGEKAGFSFPVSEFNFSRRACIKGNGSLVLNTDVPIFNKSMILIVLTIVIF